MENAIRWFAYLATILSASGLDPLLGNRSINEIQFLGAHNSGGYSDSSVDYGFNCWTRNQNINFSQMLQLGIRYFDIDLCYHDGVLKFCHTVRPWDYLRSHFFADLEEGIDDVRRFVERNPEEVVFLHINRDWHSYTNNTLMATKLFDTLNEKLGSLIFPLEAFHSQNARLPLVGELWSEAKPVILFITDSLTRYSEDLANLAGSSEKYINIIYLAYRAVETRNGLEIGDTKAALIEHQCGLRGAAALDFIDFQVIGRLYSPWHCLDQIANATNVILPEVLDLCRVQRCLATGGKMSINFLTLDYVQSAPNFLFNQYNYGLCH